jgi:hypothetical protein
MIGAGYFAWEFAREFAGEFGREFAGAVVPAAVPAHARADCGRAILPRSTRPRKFAP